MTEERQSVENRENFEIRNSKFEIRDSRFEIRDSRFEIRDPRTQLTNIHARTSCSAPVFAAIVSLLNSYRLNNGKPPLGFINPLIYQAFASDPTIFTDITTGDNKCTETCCDKWGYEATKGWDAVCTKSKEKGRRGGRENTSR